MHNMHNMHTDLLQSCLKVASNQLDFRHVDAAGFLDVDLAVQRKGRS